MSNHIQEDTLKILLPRAYPDRGEAEEPPKQMFTNKDDSAVKQPKKRADEKIGRKRLAPAVAARNISSAGGEMHKAKPYERKAKAEPFTNGSKSIALCMER